MLPGQDSLGSAEYGGPAPLTEPETRIVKLVAETSHPHAFVSLQSGAWGVHVPAAAQAVDAPTDLLELTDKLQTYCECSRPAGLEPG